MKTPMNAMNSADDPQARLNRLAARLVEAGKRDRPGLRAVQVELERLIPDLPDRVKPILESLRSELAAVPDDPDGDVTDLLIRAEGLFGTAFSLLERPEDPSASPDPAAWDRLSADRAIVEDFVVECKEFLALAEQSLLQLEKDPGNRACAEEAMRAFHTIKGSSAFLEMNEINRLAHSVESVLARIRDGELTYGREAGTRLLASVDVLSDIIQIMIAGNSAGKPSSYDPLMADLAVLAGTGGGAASGKSAGGGAARETDTPGGTGPEGGAPSAAETPDAGGRSRRDPSEQSMTRVQTRRLDRLIDMVGELVIAQSMVNQDPLVRNAENRILSGKVGQCGKIVRELHDLSMSMRMIPLKATFQRMNRLARDLAVQSGKPLRFETEGAETEIDRNMVDVINEPLIHLIRNAVDHGLEPPEERTARGKTAVGSVRLKAFNEGGFVVLEVSDDGRGLDRERIIARAEERGLLPEGGEWTAAGISEMIFRPGFSTSERLTVVSGRGIGMDVVRRGVESLKGRIDVRSREGEGCAFLIQLPLTLAVTEGMLVRVGGERYVIPTMSIHVSFRPGPEAVFTAAGRGEMVLFQNRTVPILRLNRLFGIRNGIEDVRQSSLILVGNGELRYALMVDEILGKLQVVEKGLGRALGTVPGISGGAILGDGQVGLILDVAALARAREAAAAA
jgi:two-component system, chemotaxis family, sensor kinase CheA